MNTKETTKPKVAHGPNQSKPNLVLKATHAINLARLHLRRGTTRTINQVKLHFSHSKTRIGLVSCDKWLGKVYDDLLLQRAFLDAGFKAELISWQDGTIDFSQYDALLVASMWGYQNFLPDLRAWLDQLGDTQIFNSRSVILDNLDKTKQIRLLEKHDLPIAPTTIIKKGELEKSLTRTSDSTLAKTPAPKQTVAQTNDSSHTKASISAPSLTDFPLVIKPSISSGGENTFLIRSQTALDKLLPKLREVNQDRELLVQPFLSEIKSGETSVIVIDGNIVNAVVRFPGILDGAGRYVVRPLPLEDLDSDLIDLCRKVIVTESHDQLYTRIDTVKKDGKYLIMEVESFEPQLFYYLLKGPQRKQMLDAIVRALKTRLRTAPPRTFTNITTNS